MTPTVSEQIGKNFLELIDHIRAIRNDLVDPAVGHVTFPQLKVLRVLAAHPDGMKLKELAGELKLTPGTVSTAITLMVRQGLLERSPDPVDRRAVAIRLTERGRCCRDAHFRFWHTVMGGVLREIPPEDRQTFIDVLEKINGGLQKHNG